LSGGDLNTRVLEQANKAIPVIVITEDVVAAGYLMGQSNGGLATMVALSNRESEHRYRFAAGFPVVPSCISVTIKQGEYYSPMIVFAAEKDDANLSKYCVEMMKKKRSTPLQLIMYRNSDHGFMMKSAPHVFHGWHLSYNPNAEKDMMRTIVSALKTKKFGSGVQVEEVLPRD
jgi:dienelactone hydrolase